MGAPQGNQFAAKAKRWSAAIERVIEGWPGEPNSDGCTPFMRGLNLAAHAFVSEMFEKRDAQFFREFGDRIEGKVPQQTILSGDEDNPVVVKEIRMIDLK